MCIWTLYITYILDLVTPWGMQGWVDPGTTQVSRYQKGKTSLDFTRARDSEWQWHHLGHMQVSAPRSRQITTPATTTQFFTGRMPFLPPNQQRQSTEGKVMSWPRYCSSNDAQPVPKAAYRSGRHDEHNRLQCGWNLGRLILQSDMLTTRPVRCAQVQSHSWLACSQLVVCSHICFCSNVAVPMRMYRYCRTDFVKWHLSTFHSAL